MEAMEEWGQADDRVIQRSYTSEVCISCAWFTYGIDAHCHTCVGCALMQALLEKGQHLTHSCRNWKPVHHVETGPAVAAARELSAMLGIGVHNRRAPHHQYRR